MSDAVNHPAYYNRGSVEVIEFIEDWRLDFSMGSFVKYICRAGKKDNYVQDLEKARWYIKRFVAHPSEPVPEEFGTYNWRQYAESQGLETELCIAMDSAYGIYRGGAPAERLNDVSAIIDICIARYNRNANKNNIEHGVLEMGSEAK